MRRWLMVGIPTLAVVCLGGYWLTNRNSAVNVPYHRDENRDSVVSNGKNDGDAEASDLVEPLVVERVGLSVTPSMPAAVDEGPMPRVQLTPGMTQPPRPDAEPGRVMRMPYADEDEILGISFDPVQRIMESKLDWLDIFANLPKTDKDGEEQEEVAPPVFVPPHPMHCPHMGGCPAPYPYRGMPR